jgi:hypothetical protein
MHHSKETECFLVWCQYISYLLTAILDVKMFIKTDIDFVKIIIIETEGKLTLGQAKESQKGNRGIALLFLQPWP